MRSMSNDQVLSDSSADVLRDAAQLYGSDWKPTLTALSKELRKQARVIVDQFYKQLVLLPGSRQLINQLSKAELAHLKVQQARNLTMLVSPDLTPDRHRAIALTVGRIHAVTGLAREDLVHGHDLLHTIVRTHIDAAEHGEALSVLARRLIRDLAWQTEAAQRMQALRHSLLLEITRLAWQVESYTDLIGKTIDLLSAHDEIAGCTFGRPDVQGMFRVEVLGGKGMAAFMDYVGNRQASKIMAGESPASHGPTGQAWNSKQIERCLNFATDPLVEPWLQGAQEGGFRSSVAVPLVTPGAATPATILSLYSRLPGGFSSDEQVAFLTQLQTLLVFSIARLEAMKGSVSTIPYATRRHWLGLLQNGGLEMHYQPVMELGSHKITKVEALARLRDGNWTLRPSQFFPALSSDDFLTLYVEGLNQVLLQRAKWAQAGLELDISINLPVAALENMRYFEATRWSLQEHACPPEALTLEILETDEASPVLDLGAVLGRFKQLGVSLAEDDLGSGYSGLSRLREMPFDIIKIDRSIVSRAEDDPSNILRFIYQLTRLGHSLGKQVIAEGVEDPELLEAITVLGTDCVQGYVIAKPMPAAELERWLASPVKVQRVDPRRPRSTWAKLARLLIWEEGLHLLLGEAAALASREAMLRELCDDMLEVFPAASPAREAQERLAAQAMAFGLRSREYALARANLVSALAPSI